MTAPADLRGVLVELSRATALFQARAVAAHLGAPMPNPEAFRVVNGRAVEALRFIPVTKD